MFTEEQRASVRFLRYNQSVPCAECGKKKRVLWTLLCTFNAMSFGQFNLVNLVNESGKDHPPLTPVCTDHPMGPAWPKEEKEEHENPGRSDAVAGDAGKSVTEGD
jgi:hypothetical protein